MFQKLAALSKQIGDMDEMQQQLLGQADLAAEVVQQAAMERTMLSKQVQEIGRVVAQLRLEKMVADLESYSGSSSAEESVGRNRGNRKEAARRSREESVVHTPRNHHRAETRGDSVKTFLPKLSFPKFRGENPTIWLDKCEDYFEIYKVNRHMWVMAASLHMEGNAAKWWQVYKAKKGLGNWEQFSKAVKAKFGVDEYSKVMRCLLSIKQKGSVQEYISEFETLRYSATMNNIELDETLFVTQFIQGLKHDIQVPVESQLPPTVDRATTLALMQEVIQERGRFKSGRGTYSAKQTVSASKFDTKVLVPSSYLSKERQLREYRRANGLCYSCGEKFEPGHLQKCPKRVQLQLNALSTEDMNMVLTEQTLQQLQQEDEAAEVLRNLSLNAAYGTDHDESIKVRALIKD